MANLRGCRISNACLRTFKKSAAINDFLYRTCTFLVLFQWHRSREKKWLVIVFFLDMSHYLMSPEESMLIKVEMKYFSLVGNFFSKMSATWDQVERKCCCDCCLLDIFKWQRSLYIDHDVDVYCRVKQKIVGMEKRVVNLLMKQCSNNWKAFFFW